MLSLNYAVSFAPVQVLACVVLLASLPVAEVRAQRKSYTPRPCEERALEETKWMFSNLFLSTEQYDRIREINISCSCVTDSLDRVKDKKTSAQLRQHTLHSKDSVIKALLTQDQYAQYKSHRGKKPATKKSPFSTVD